MQVGKILDLDQNWTNRDEAKVFLNGGKSPLTAGSPKRGGGTGHCRTVTQVNGVSETNVRRLLTGLAAEEPNPAEENRRRRHSSATAGLA